MMSKAWRYVSPGACVCLNQRGGGKPGARAAATTPSAVQRRYAASYSPGEVTSVRRCEEESILSGR